jgi:hypothetical protein
MEYVVVEINNQIHILLNIFLYPLTAYVRLVLSPLRVTTILELDPDPNVSYQCRIRIQPTRYGLFTY